MRENDIVIPLVTEELQVATRKVSTGRVRVQTTTELVEEIAKADLETENVEVTRVPIDREVAEIPQVRTEDGMTIVPVFEEVLFVEKRLVLKEEIHIRRRTTTEEFETAVQLRKQHGSVERLDTPSSNLRSEED